MGGIERHDTSQHYTDTYKNWLIKLYAWMAMVTMQLTMSMLKHA
jgi:hypothetical protein